MVDDNENSTEGERRRTEAEVLAQLDAVTSPLKDCFGTNPDMWQSQSRYR